jgi:YVTN family beta-propeller protein
MKHKIFDAKTTGHSYLKPYWTTEGLNNTCWISLSGSDSVAVLDFSTKKELAYLPVGDHPQRVRHGYVREEALAAANASSKAAVQGRTSLTAAEPLSRLDSPPAPMVTDQVTSAGASLLSEKPGPWLPATMLGLLMLASLAYRMRTHAAVVRTKRR